MTFSEDEVERYARHLVLAEVGGPGQQALKRASVLVVGCGGATPGTTGHAAEGSSGGSTGAASTSSGAAPTVHDGASRASPVA